MNYKNLSNQELINKLKEKAKAEKALTLEVITLIREVESRRLFLEMGYGSLFEYVTKELGYDESAALRRISAARLIKEMPEVEAKISEGKLTLSNIAQAQIFFRKEEKVLHKKLSSEDKREVLVKIESRSSRDTQKILAHLSPEQIKLAETIRPIAEDLIQVKIVIDQSLEAKLQKLKGLWSHKNSNMTYAELINELADMALKKCDPTSKKASVISPSASQVQNVTKHNRYVSSELRRQIWMRDQGRCTYVHRESNRQCGSKFQLEIHHEEAFAKGGKTEFHNLRLLCRAHNGHTATKDFGESKMSTYLKTFKPETALN